MKVPSSIHKDDLVALDRALLRDPEWKQETAEILRLQRRLRRLVGPEAWQVYLLLEAATNRRMARGLEVALGESFRPGWVSPVFSEIRARAVDPSVWARHVAPLGRQARTGQKQASARWPG